MLGLVYPNLDEVLEDLIVQQVFRQLRYISPLDTHCCGGVPYLLGKETEYGYIFAFLGNVSFWLWCAGIVISIVHMCEKYSHSRTQTRTLKEREGGSGSSSALSGMALMDEASCFV